MIKVGIDVGSTRTKYAVIDEHNVINLWSEKTPIRQKEFFSQKIYEFEKNYNQLQVVSCGYGKANVPGIKNINELKALAYGITNICSDDVIALDIGGQDTKLIAIKDGNIKDFFLNEKCAAGCGQFLTNILTTLNYDFNSIDLLNVTEPEKKLSSVCAVFAQTEIVSLISEGVCEKELVIMVLWQILSQAKKLLTKIDCEKVILTGGLAQIPHMQTFAEIALEKKIEIPKNCNYLSAIGCALL